MNVILCADDFGYSKAISNGIIRLCELKKINATSVLIESPNIDLYIERLKKLQLENKIQIGLHLNLTDNFNHLNLKLKNKFNLFYLILNFALRFNEVSIIYQNIINQLSLFVDKFGFIPDFIDGHEHVHIFPFIRKYLFFALNEFLEKYNNHQINTGTLNHDNIQKRPWIRQVNPSYHADSIIKCIVLNILNFHFSKGCKANNFKTNDSFDGVYSFKFYAFKILIKEGLYSNKSNDNKNKVIMLHPSEKFEFNIKHSDTRVKEFKYLLENIHKN